MTTDPSDPPTVDVLARSLAGDRDAQEELYDRVRAELHRRAALWMRRQAAGHTLQATALVNEAWLKLMDGAGASWNGRDHFVRLASRAMRSVLVDHARSRATAKRGGRSRRESLGDLEAGVDPSGGELVALDEALTRLAEVEARLAQIAELKLFGGLEHDEIARLLELSSRTVDRSWKAARTWLRAELAE